MARNSYIKFDTSVRDYFGSNNTAIVFGRLLYWFSKKPSGFYKFKQRCEKHPLYKEGDSWGEELGMSRKMLDPIMSRLVSHHKTKKAYMASEDKFSGKMFCSYTNHKTSQTHYFVNREALDGFLASLSVSEAPARPNQPAVIAKSHSSDVPNEQPLVCARQQPINTQTTTSLSGDVLTAQKEEEKLISKKMVELWNSHAEDAVAWLPSLAAKLCKALYEHFKGCLENFKNYCETIGSSQFLTGKSQSKFKAFLFWAIKPEVIQSILLGAYGVKSFFSMSEPHEKKIKEDIAHINNQIKFVEQSIASAEQQIRDGQKKLVEELKATLSQEEIDAFREESDREFFEKSPSLPDDNPRISMASSNAYFEGRDGFLNRVLKERLGLSDIIVAPQDLLGAKGALECERVKKVNQLNELHTSKRKMRKLVLSPVLLSKI